jgi:adenine deaminase
MVTAPGFARAVVPSGTTAVVADPHEIANVLGVEGIRSLIDSARGLPLDVFVMAPSCVPATHLETAGASLSAADLVPFYSEPSVLGLAEMMNVPGVLFKDPGVLEKIRSAKNGRVDGHAPGLSGKELSAYIAAGIRSDHESTSAGEALEKIRKGMTVFIREGTAAKNLEALLPLVRAENDGAFAFCTDDRHPADLLEQGHVNYAVRRAVGLGMDPALAVRLATRNPALHFGLRDRGAVAPGALADLVVWDSLEDRFPAIVFKNGKREAERGSYLAGMESIAPVAPSPFHMKPFGPERLRVRADGSPRLRVIGLVPDQIVTRSEWMQPTLVQGTVRSDTDCDVLKIIVAERHRGTGNVGIGFVRGFGLKRGAIGSSVAHDSHNCIVVGTNDEDMAFAAAEIAAMRGGLVAVEGGKVRAALELPVAGLLSNAPLEEVARCVEALNAAAHAMGGALRDPFMQLSFLALPVIPELKITDLGLVDVAAFDLVPLLA